MTAFIHDNIEYIIPTMFKATKLEWARDLIDNGAVYFTNIRQFIYDDHPKRGDSNEGRHIIIRNNSRCTVKYSLPIYVWCCTLDTNASRVIKSWPDRECVIQILDTVAFAKRITSALGKERPTLWPLRVGPVAYTKTDGAYENTDWADGVFQKDERYDNQKEFRFALNAKTNDEYEDQIILKLGSCKDIVRIVNFT